MTPFLLVLLGLLNLTGVVEVLIVNKFERLLGVLDQREGNSRLVRAVENIPEPDAAEQREHGSAGLVAASTFKVFAVNGQVYGVWARRDVTAEPKIQRQLR